MKEPSTPTNGRAALVALATGDEVAIPIGYRGRQRGAPVRLGPRARRLAAAYVERDPEATVIGLHRGRVVVHGRLSATGPRFETILQANGDPGDLTEAMRDGESWQPATWGPFKVAADQPAPPDAPAAPAWADVPVGPCPVDVGRLVGQLSAADWSVLARMRSGAGRWQVLAHRSTRDAAQRLAHARRGRGWTSTYDAVHVVPPNNEAPSGAGVGAVAPVEPRRRYVPGERFAPAAGIVAESGVIVGAEEPATDATVQVIPLVRVPGEAMVMVGPMPTAEAEELARVLAGGGR